MRNALLILASFLLVGPTQTFDVLSVKPANPNTPGMSIQTNRGRFVGRGVTLAFLIQFAYQLKPFQIFGGPTWINSEKYEIEGKFDAEENKNNDDKLLLMLQAGLTDRFKLKSHRETRELPIFVLGVAKGGPILRPAQDVSKSSMQGGRQSARGANSHSLTSTGSTLANLAAQLSQNLGRKVIDQTGLKGSFDFTLEWTDDISANSGITVDSPAGPSLFTALQEQLGLKLEASKGPVEVFVVDTAERPSAN